MEFTVGELSGVNIHLQISVLYEEYLSSALRWKSSLSRSEHLINDGQIKHIYYREFDSLTGIPSSFGNRQHDIA